METLKSILYLFTGILIIGCTDSQDDLKPEIEVPHDPVVDIDGNIYNTMKIKDQIWITNNLNVSHFKKY
jgi:hypothetical protein